MIRLALAAALLPAAASSVAAQTIDLRELFSNDRFFEKSGLLRGRGDVDFVADVWLLPGPADSTRALIGVSMSNSALRFVRVPEGGWRTSYTVAAVLDPEEGPNIEREWEKSLDVASFDETLLTGETIVFQSELPLASGKYDLSLRVTDRNAGESARAEAEIEVPAAGPAAVLGEPVLLRLLERQGDRIEYVVHPSHTFPTPPERIEFMVVARATGAAAPLVARASLVEQPPDEDDEEDIEGEAGVGALATWSDTLTPRGDGSLTAFGALEGDAPLGELRLEVALVDATGVEVVRSQTPLLVAGSAAWIVENWKDVLSLIKYAATEREIEILENIVDPSGRIEAWTCFWRMRDPIPASAINEGMQDYFDRIQTANEMWRSALQPGYQSDRGRVFVTLGPPDDIQSNPLPRDTPPFEVWTYYSGGKQFQIVFADRIGFNNYQLETMGTYQRELSAIERRRRQFLEGRAHLCPVLQPAFERED